MTMHHFLTSLMLTQAEGGGQRAPGAFDLSSIFFLVLMFAVIYFLLIRPANKQRKQHQAMLNELKKDDEIVTSGGILGRIVAIEDKVATVEVADKVKVRVLRDRIAGKSPGKEAPASAK